MDDFATLVAGTLVVKGAEALVAGGTGAVRRIFELARRRLGHDSVVLDGAVANPDDEARRVRLAEAIAEAMRRDPDFAAQLRAQWQAAPELGADRGATVNHFRGRAHKVVQARDIHGDLWL